MLSARTISIYFCISQIFYAHAIIAADIGEAEALSIEREAIRQRMLISTGEVEITVENTKTVNGIESKDAKLFHIVWDGDKRRLVRDVYPDGEIAVPNPNMKNKDMVCFNTPQPGNYYHINLGRSALMISDENRGQPLFAPADPRLLGITHHSFDSIAFFKESANGFVANADRNNTRFSISETGTVKHLVCRWNRKVHNIECEIKYDLGKDNSPVHFLSSGVYEDKHWKFEINVSLRYHEQAAKWFPHVVDIVQTGSSPFRNTATVKVISLNQPIDKSVFEPASFNLRVGLPLDDKTNPKAGKLWWDGSAFTPQRPGNAKAIKHPE